MIDSTLLRSPFGPAGIVSDEVKMAFAGVG